jgi:hypothetical protein
MDPEQNELDYIFEEELSDDSSNNSLFSNELNSPLKNLDFDDDNNNNIDFSDDDSFKKIKRKRISIDAINEKLRKYTNMKNI